MIKIQPHIAKVRGMRGGKVVIVKRDMGQDMIYLVETAELPNGKIEDVEQHIGYVLRQPGSPINYIVPGISDATRRDVKLKIAERDAAIEAAAGDPNADVMDWYGKAKEVDNAGVDEHEQPAGVVKDGDEPESR